MNDVLVPPVTGVALVVMVLVVAPPWPVALLVLVILAGLFVWGLRMFRATRRSQPGGHHETGEQL